MIHALLIVFGLLSFVGPVFGSEKNNQISFDADVELGKLLFYCDSKYIETSNNMYDMKWKHNEPFVRVSFDAKGMIRSATDRSNKPLSMLIEEGRLTHFIKDTITHIPFRFFLENNSLESQKFKQITDELFSFYKEVHNETKLIQIKLGENCLRGIQNNYSPQDWLDEFEKRLHCTLGSLVEREDGTKRLLWIGESTVELDRELDEAGIRCKVGKECGYGVYGQQYEHGPNSCFGEQRSQKKALLYTRIKKLLCYGSLAALLIYVLYQKNLLTRYSL